jgi:uncharacterized repeat protein (TIGR01451 family)
MASQRSSRAGSAAHRPSRPSAEPLEDRVVPSTLEVPLIPDFDQFGNQFMTVQVYDPHDGLGERVTFGIFDTGASPVTFGWTDQFLFEFESMPIPLIPGATVTAEGVGGSLTGLVSQPGTLSADGMHALGDFDVDDLFGWGVVDLSEAATAEGIQAMVGTEDGSPNLPTITGTPIMNGRLAGSTVDGVAALIDQQGYEIDFGELFPGFGFDGLVLPMPDLFFVAPGTQLAPGPETTEVVRVPVTFFGIDNHLDPGDTITESYNPLVAGIELNSAPFTVANQTFLFDTGAQLSVISTAIAESLGLDLDNPEYTIDVGGAGGEMTVGGYTIDSLVVPRDDDNNGVNDGELIFTDVPVFVLDIAPGIDGILGMNLFNPAAQMLYDPWDPDGTGPGGPSLQFTFSTADREVFDPGDLGDIGVLGSLGSLLQTFLGTIGGSQLPGLEFNELPTVAADNAAVTVNEGQTASNTGTFGDGDGDTVQITASVGTVTRSGTSSGTWTWSLPTTDNTTGPVTVTITADDGRDTRTTTFTYHARDVAPTITLSGNNQVNKLAPYTLRLGAVTDPGADTVGGYRVRWGDGTSTGFVAGSPTGAVLRHAYATPGARTIVVDLFNEDASPHAAAGSKSVTVLNAAPNLRVLHAGPAAAARGALATFAVTVTNLGNAAATGAFVTFQLPVGMRLAAGGTAGWQLIGPRKYRLALGTLDPAESVRVVIQARVLPTAAVGGLLTTTSTVGTDGLNGPDANPADNVFRLRTRVR